MPIQPSRILCSAVVCLLSLPLCAQKAKGKDLASLLREVQTHAAAADTQSQALMTSDIGEHLAHDPLPVVKANLPKLISLTESADPGVRRLALISFIGLSERYKPKTPINQHQIDLSLSGLKLLVPYIPRLAPRLKDADPGTRTVCMMDFMYLAILRPVPPSLTEVLLTTLRDPHSTTSPGITTVGRFPQSRFSQKQTPIGPGALALLLAARSTASSDPATHPSEYHESPEMQAIAIQFLERPDQTPESLAATIGVLAGSVQAPDVNAHLVPLLDDPDEKVQLAMLENLNRLTLSPGDYEVARAKVTKLKTDPKASAQVRSEASQLLLCWSNKHYPCTVPCGPNCVYANAD